MVSAAAVEQPEGLPRFVQLVAHPLRWRLLRELTESDRAVRELTERLAEPQNLVSYHLRRLRDGGLVQARRSAADGRDSYYAIDLEHCEQQLEQASRALHPGLSCSSTSPKVRARRVRVLFLCTGNSARSQIAEALLTQMSGGAAEASSAGSHPKPLHRNAVRVMCTRGVDISGNRTKHFDEFVGERFDLVVTLCDRVREVCPEFGPAARLVHWSIPDPDRAGLTNRASYPAFVRTAVDLETRIRFLLPMLTQPSTVNRTRRSTHVQR